MNILSKNNKNAVAGSMNQSSCSFDTVRYMVDGEITTLKCHPATDYCIKCRLMNRNDILKCPSCGQAADRGSSICGCGTAMVICGRGVVRAVSVPYGTFKNEDDII